MRVGRSPAGAGIRSRAGALTSAVYQNLRGTADGFATADMYSFTRDNAIAFGRSNRQDNPYGTVDFYNDDGVYSAVNLSFGKFSNGATDPADPNFGAILRRRWGFTFLAPWHSAALVNLKIQIVNWTNTLETWIPRVYASNSIDNALYMTGIKPGPTWENNLDDSIGTLAYGVTAEQTLPLPAGVVAAHAGVGLSIVIGEDAEMIEVGAGAGTPFTDNASGDFLPTAGLNYSVVIEYTG